MAKTNHFIAGMPRSGSTLLCNILCQNPNFWATGTSPLPQLLIGLNNVWTSSPEAKANYDDQDKKYLLRGVIDNYHRPFGTASIIFDKSRAWPAYIETLQALLDENPKILVCTRNMPDIMASFEKIWRKESKNLGMSLTIPAHMATLQGRLNFWAEGNNVVGSAYEILKDAVVRGHKDCMFRVDYFDLTTNPRKTMMAIHEYLEEPWYEYDFNNVIQQIHEKDEFHGFSDGALHTIRSKVEYMPSDAEKILGNYAYGLSKYRYDFLD